MKALALHHVSVNVRDVDAAVRFYVDVLGMALRADRPAFGFGGAWLDAGEGGQQLHLIEAPVPDGLGQHFALLVEDLDDVVADLRGRGTEISDPVPVGDSAHRQAFLTDPSGNLVELHERARA